jgi:pilus assembly protein CpaF
VISPEKQAKGPAFTIVISEKGGAERREVFDRTELGVGRVQGNDLMLPKGNVSKRHARLLYRDGRFIVTDLNSTNGTYVNRRRISQATIVREGDRIYIGDFVLRIEVSDGSADSAPVEATGSGPVPSRQAPTSSQADPSRPDISVEQLESGDSGSSYPRVPGPPRMPSGARASADSAPSDSDPSTRIPQPMPEPSRPSLDVGPSVADDRLSQEATQYRAALVSVVERARGAIDQAALEGRLDDALIARIERTIAEQSAALRNEGTIGTAIPNDALSRDARAELVELGPLGPLLDDSDVTEIAVPRFDHVLAHRGGRSAPVEPPFSSEGTLRLALGRLCRAADAPFSSADAEIERRLPNGVRVSALVGPAGTMLVLKKPRRSVATFEELVRRGTISRAIATFLQQCVSARTNILVVGPRDAAVPAVVSALAGAAGDARVIAVQDLDELVATAAATRLSYGSEPEQAARAVQLAARFSDARLVVELCAPELTLATIDAVGEGADGVTAALRAPNLRRALARLPAELCTGRPSMNLSAARELIAGAFEVALEVSRLRDGRHRVVRVAEISAGPDELHAQDIFSFVIERTAAGGAIEGAFVPSGTIPRVVEDMTARGIVVETSLFTRPPSR